jgi:hypothetical protein
MRESVEAVSAIRALESANKDAMNIEDSGNNYSSHTPLRVDDEDLSFAKVKQFADEFHNQVPSKFMENDGKLRPEKNTSNPFSIAE